MDEKNRGKKFLHIIGSTTTTKVRVMWAQLYIHESSVKLPIYYVASANAVLFLLGLQFHSGWDSSYLALVTKKIWFSSWTSQLGTFFRLGKVSAECMSCLY